MSHPIPEKGLAGRVYSEPRGGSVSVVTGIRVGGHPVLVLRCDERGETELHRLLREVVSQWTHTHYFDRADYPEIIARIDALLAPTIAPGDAGDEDGGTT